MTSPTASLLARHPDALALLACPHCGGALRPELVCEACDARFAQLEGRPILLPQGVSYVPAKQNGVLDAQAAFREQRVRRGVRGAVDRFRQATTTQVFADDRLQVRLLVEAVRARLRPGSWVVDVGAAEQYYRAELETLGRVLALDISPYAATDVIADCHRLPFQPGSIDAFCAIEVLEHVERPWVFFEQCARALRPGGLFFGVTPQYCPTHGFPYDFFRYTRGGLASLGKTCGLELVEAWPLGGAWGTLLHWYWANHARESPLRKIPVVNLGYHLWFQTVARALDRLDAASGYGREVKAQEHNDHVGWSFVFAKRD